jgi:hypothetical protein
MIYLSTYNTSYGQKKGWESKCQFDSQPLKVKNRPKYVHAIGKFSMKATTLL